MDVLNVEELLTLLAIALQELLPLDINGHLKNLYYEFQELSHF